MKILISIKSILNYLYNNLIDLVWTKKIRFADGTEMDTVPTSFDLFDIKTMSERIATKGWSCISYPTQNKLSKTDVPTAYNFLKDKLDNVDGNISSWYYSPTSSNYYQIRSWLLGDTCLMQKKHSVNIYNMGLCTCSKADINDITKWVELDIPNIMDNTNVAIGENIIVYEDRNNGKGIVLNRNFEKIYEIAIENITHISGICSADGYIYLNCDGITYRIPDTTTTSLLIPEFVYSQYRKTITKVFSKINGKYFFNIHDSNMNKLFGYYATNILDSTTYVQDSNWYFFVGEIENKALSVGNFGYNNHQIMITEDFVNYDTLIDFSSFDLTPFTTNNNITHLYNVFNTDDNQFVVCLSDGNGNFLYLKTADFVSFTKLLETTTEYTIFNSISDLSICSVANDYGYATNDMVIIPIVFTDTINGIDIKYYKNGDFKICTPDIAVGNDTNLQSVFEFLGYLNYWWIDTTNDQITLQRNSNLWSMMYVGDDYEDDELPSGQYKASLKKIVLSEAPTTSTVGSVGDICIDTTNGDVYICIGVSGSTYTWSQISIS